MTPSSAQFLLTEQGREITASIPAFEGDSLAAGTFLRKRHPDIDPAHLAAAAELAETRRKAVVKFTRAEKMFFTREALEQSSGELVASHRAGRFSGLGPVMDACSGVGGDAIALSAVVGRLDCVDLDSGRLAFCAENCSVYGNDNVSLIEHDVSDIIERVSEYDAVFIDPARRKGGRRSSGLDRMEPTWDICEKLLATAVRGAVKLSPSVDLGSIEIPHETEWISTAGGLKEAVVWTGAFRQCETTVSLLHHKLSIRDSDLPAGEPALSGALSFIHEPDPALIRSGLLGRYAASLGMSLITPDIAYMSSEVPVADPCYTSYRILDSMPFNLKKLERLLNGMNVGRVTVKKRGFPMLPEEVAKKLRLNGEKEAIIICTKDRGKNSVFVVERM